MNMLYSITYPAPAIWGFYYNPTNYSFKANICFQQQLLIFTPLARYIEHNQV